MANVKRVLFPYPVRVLLAVAAGLLIWRLVDGALVPGVMAAAKFRGRSDCSWRSIANVTGQYRLLDDLTNGFERQVSITAVDPKLGLLSIRSERRQFWIKANGEEKDGKSLLSYLLAEHEWVSRVSSDLHVRPGDIVLDCGAHVGVFTAKALERGASKVVAIEPEPLNLECLRRNFEREIAVGRVVVYPKGVWSSETTLALNVAPANSGSNSVVLATGGSVVRIPLTTVDKLVGELALPRVDFIKMDIEGAEREALRGAAATLKRFRPRLMLDAYHRPDDPQVLPAVIAAARPDYEMQCGPCEPSENRSGHWTPHVVFFH